MTFWPSSEYLRLKAEHFIDHNNMLLIMDAKYKMLILTSRQFSHTAKMRALHSELDLHFSISLAEILVFSTCVNISIALFDNCSYTAPVCLKFIIYFFGVMNINAVYFARLGPEQQIVTVRAPYRHCELLVWFILDTQLLLSFHSIKNGDPIIIIDDTTLILYLICYKKPDDLLLLHTKDLMTRQLDAGNGSLKNIKEIQQFRYFVELCLSLLMHVFRLVIMLPVLTAFAQFI